MKKIYKNVILFACLVLSANSFATTYTITVENYQFSPATLNVSVGDTVLWTWINGTHIVESLSGIPVGANSWSNPINSSSTQYSYVVAVAGTYNYHCAIHSSMTGSFTATSTGINSPLLAADFNVYQVRTSTFNISYTLRNSAEVNLSVFDLTGKLVQVLVASSQPAGVYKDVYYMEDLQRGIYLVELISDNQRLSKRIVIE